MELARAVLQEKESAKASLDDRGLETLISVGSSAGGAKAKAIIAINDDASDVLSGQTDVPDGFEHWILKFDEMENEELATAHQIGRIEYAYNSRNYFPFIGSCL